MAHVYFLGVVRVFGVFGAFLDDWGLALTFWVSDRGSRIGVSRIFAWQSLGGATVFEEIRW